ncbi:MAG: hypothetical protein AAF226_14660, partial [Verrucomicrobiota bacterium]
MVKKSGGGFFKTLMLVTLGLGFLIAVGAALFVGKLWSDERGKVMQAERDLMTLRQKASELEAKNSTLNSELSSKQLEISRLKADWETQVSNMKSEHEQEMKNAYAQMNDLVYNGQSALEYISSMEKKLKTGMAIDRAEARKLEATINGLAVLHEQYKKPLAEFKQLSNYFDQQLKTIQATREGPRATARPINDPLADKPTAVDPKETTGIFKRIIQNKKFQQERAEYFEQIGRQAGKQAGIEQGRAEGRVIGREEAIRSAKVELDKAYNRAQGQMRALALNKDEYLADLDKILKSNQINASDVEQFFNKSKEVLQIHNGLMNTQTTREGTV